MKMLNWIAGVLVIVGALNWGLVGFFNFNLVTTLFADMHMMIRIVYCAVGIAGVWMIFPALRCCRK